MTVTAGKTAFVFAGGGSLGAIQVGMLRDFGAQISAWRHFKGCRADVYRGYHGGLSCRSS